MFAFGFLMTTPPQVAALEAARAVAMATAGATSTTGKTTNEPTPTTATSAAGGS